MAGVDGGECDQAFVVTWASDVERLKARLSPIAEALDLGVRACTALDPNDRKAWELFIVEWRTFKARSTPFFGSYNEWITACSYAHTLDAWREKLVEKCVVPGPNAIKGADSSSFKWAVAAAIVGIVAIGTRAWWLPR